MKERTTFSTKSLNLCAYLLSTGEVKLSRVDRNNPKEIFFFFEPSETASELLEQYFLDNALVNPKSLFAKLNELRDLVFSGGKYG